MVVEKRMRVDDDLREKTRLSAEMGLVNEEERFKTSFVPWSSRDGLFMIERRGERGDSQEDPWQDESNVENMGSEFERFISASTEDDPLPGEAAGVLSSEYMPWCALSAFCALTWGFSILKLMWARSRRGIFAGWFSDCRRGGFMEEFLRTNSSKHCPALWIVWNVYVILAYCETSRYLHAVTWRHMEINVGS
jgi:hypothetical protein